MKFLKEGLKKDLPVQRLLKMNLQTFAEPPAIPADPATPPAVPAAQTITDPPADPNAIIFDDKQKSEVDRQISKAVDSALKKQQTATQALIDQEVKKATDKAAEYAKLTEEQKNERILSEREEKVIEAEKNIKVAQLKTVVEADLMKKELPTSIADVLVLIDDTDKINTIVNDLKASLDEKANSIVNERLRQKTPNTSTQLQTGQASGTSSLAARANEKRIIGKD